MKSIAGIGGCSLVAAVPAVAKTPGNDCCCCSVSETEVEAAAAAAAGTGCCRFASAIVAVAGTASSEVAAGEETIVAVAEIATEDTVEEVAKLEAPMLGTDSAVAAVHMSEEVEVYIEAAVPEEEEAAVATGQVESIVGAFGRTAVVVVAVPAEGRQEQEEAEPASAAVEAEPVWLAEERLLWRQFFRGGSAQSHRYCPDGSCLRVPWLDPTCSPFHQSWSKAGGSHWLYRTAAAE